MSVSIGEFESYLRIGKAVQNINLASLCLLIYDCFVTLPDEVQYIWPSHWSFVKVLYLTTRYLGLIDGAFGIISVVHPVPHPETSRLLLIIGTWIAFYGLVVSESIMVLRIRALYGKKNQKIRFFFIVFGSLVFGGGVTTQYLTNKGIKFISSPIPGLSRSVMVPSKGFRWIEMMLLAIFEVVIVFLTVLKALAQRAASRMSLLHVFYRDGLLYFLLSFTCSIVNVIMLLRAPVQLIMLQRVLHSCLSARMILHLREASTFPIIDVPPRLSTISYFDGGTQESIEDDDNIEFAI